ncbi:fibrinogen-like protein 1 [Cochliomyia hominivorax]
MASFILAINFVILIFVTSIKCFQQPKWSNGHPTYSRTPNFVGGSNDILSNLELIEIYINNLIFRINTGTLRTFPIVNSLADTRFFDIRFDHLPPHCNNSGVNPPRSCAEATSCTHRSGIYQIKLTQMSLEPFLVSCDITSHGGDWTVILRRADNSENFDRVWSDYVNGFGNVQGDFFIGLDRLHAMTNYNGPQELIFLLKDKNEEKYAKYDNFVVGHDYELYRLNHVGAYSGNAGDSFSYHLKQKFSTRDHDNDKDGKRNCAALIRTGFWYNQCPKAKEFGGSVKRTGLSWQTFRGLNNPVDYAVMMIRRRRYQVE